MVISKKCSTFATSKKNKQQFKSITIMKTYITKLFYGSDDKKVEFVKKFNSYKDAFEYLNRLCGVFREDGVKVIRCDDYVIDLPKFKVEYRIEGKAHMATKIGKEYWNNH